MRITRDQLLSALHAEGIGSGVHYVPIHMQPFYADTMGFQPEDFPAARAAGETMFSLPLSPHLTDDDVLDVVQSVTRILRYYAT